MIEIYKDFSEKTLTEINQKKKEGFTKKRMKDEIKGIGEWKLTKKAKLIADEMVKECIIEDKLQEEMNRKKLK